MKVVVVAMVMLVARANAFWFWGRNDETTATADGRPIEQSCIEEGEAGSCEFFNCFEQRLPCGRQYYMLRFGNHYCNRFQRFLDSFTEPGQEFLINSQQCVTEGLIEFYRREYMNCHDLEHAAIALIQPCYLRHGFCNIIVDNSDQFLEVFQIGDLFRGGSAKLWREVFGLARECGGQALANFARATSSRLTPFLRSIFEGKK